MALAGLIFFYIGISMGWLYVRTPSALEPCYSYTHAQLTDFYGSHPRIWCRSNRTVYNLEQSKQVGMYRRICNWIWLWTYRLAGYDQCVEWECY